MSLSGPDNQYDTLIDALNAAADRGFTYHFSVKKGFLICEESGEEFSDKDVFIEEFHRSEGASDPEDSAIIYLIETKTRLKGTLIDAFGTYANEEVSAFINKIPINRSETKGIRRAKLCPNCGTELKGSYCYVCGQKDEHLHEPFYKLFGHAIADYWHFDSKFLNTMLRLFTKPGFLTMEFVAGKRARYVHPVRLYFFISVIFFLVYFSFFSKKMFSGISHNNDPFSALGDSALLENELVLPKERAVEIEEIGSIKDSLLKTYSQEDNARKKESGVSLQRTDSSASADSTEKDWEPEFSLVDKPLPATIELYNDSIKRLPRDQRPSWLQQHIDRQSIHLRDKAAEEGEGEILKEILEGLNHNLPKLMFVLLPFFALILKLVYIRHNIYFVDHAIFTLHFHAFTFLVFLVLLLLNLAFGWPVSAIWYILLTLLYLFIAMRNVYHQSYLKTFFKLLTIMMLYSICLIVVMLIGLFFSMMTL